MHEDKDSEMSDKENSSN